MQDFVLHFSHLCLYIIALLSIFFPTLNASRKYDKSKKINKFKGYSYIGTPRVSPPFNGGSTQGPSRASAPVDMSLPPPLWPPRADQIKQL